MNLIIAITLVFALLAAFACWRALTTASAANIGEGIHAKGLLSRFSDSALTTRHLLVQLGDSDSDVDICTATTEPLGFALDEVAAADLATQKVAVAVPGGGAETRLAVPAVTINTGDKLYTAAAGKVTNVPVPGCYHVGRALTDGEADGLVEVDPVRFGEPWIYRQIVTLAGGAATEAHTITGLTTDMAVQATILDDAGNVDLYLVDVTVTADTATLRFNEDPGDGVKVCLEVAPATVTAVDLGA